MMQSLNNNWIIPDWPAPEPVKAVVTTREGGVSRPPYDAFNLAAHVGDDPDLVQQNRSILMDGLGLSRQPAWLEQVHGTTVINTGVSNSHHTADASVAFDDSAVCAVLTADCLPVLFCDRSGSRVAAAHAGWRGLAAGILEASIKALECQPAELMAWLGPAIGPHAFEVGNEVRQVFVDYSSECKAAFRQNESGRWMADLYQLACIRLRMAGVSDCSGGGFCTFTDQQRFYSYRRDGNTGRMASLIWLQSD